MFEARLGSLPSVARMFRSIWIRTGRVSAIAAFVAFASLWIQSGRVEAACGDYVYVRGQLPHSNGASMSEATSSPDTVHRESTGKQDLPTQLPCRGPSCSNEPDSPAAPAPTIERAQEQWACVVADGLSRDTGCRSMVDSSDAGVSEGFVLGILRPPR
jgi:hypothetical protein